MKTRLPFIYICSLMRTGSTLVQELLMEKGKCFIFHEPWFGSGMFQGQQMTADMLAEWGLNTHRILGADRSNFNSSNISYSLMFLYLSRCLPQCGVKEVRHNGWQMYLNLFDDIRWVLLGREPKDLFVSIHRFRQNWDGWWSPYKGRPFSVDTLVKELQTDINRQLEIAATQPHVETFKYEDICIGISEIERLRKFTQSPVKNPVIGDIHKRLERNKHEKNHAGMVTWTGSAFENEPDPVVKIMAEEFAEKMTDYNKFWGY